jgi:hypothetical protein
MKKFIRALEIMAPHYEKGMDTDFFMEAEHDIVYFHVTGDQIPEDSPEGTELQELGLHLSSDVDCWAKFV